MKQHNEANNSDVRPNRSRTSLTTRALGAALALSALSVALPATVAGASDGPVAGQGASGPEIVKAEKALSQVIADRKPVTFLGRIAYFHGSGQRPTYVENPLEATTPEGHKLIGYFEPQGKSPDPIVNLFQYDPATTSLSTDPADPEGMPKANEVVFASRDRAANTADPINPATGGQYIDRGGNPLLVGSQYDAKQ